MSKVALPVRVEKSDLNRLQKEAKKKKVKLSVYVRQVLGCAE